MFRGNDGLGSGNDGEGAGLQVTFPRGSKGRRPEGRYPPRRATAWVREI